MIRCTLYTRLISLVALVCTGCACSRIEILRFACPAISAETGEVCSFAVVGARVARAIEIALGTLFCGSQGCVAVLMFCEKKLSARVSNLLIAVLAIALTE